MKYLVDSYAGWFIVDTKSKRLAYSEGVKEFGRGGVKSVSRAKQSDIDCFIATKGKDAMATTSY